jgi:hypothetical protein
VSTDFPTTPGAFQRTLSGGLDGFLAKLNPTGTALVYSTYLGDTGVNGGTGIAADAAGAAYVTGGTEAAGFPITSGAFQPVLRGDSDAIVMKLNPTGSGLVYSTYLGSSSSDRTNASRWTRSVTCTSRGPQAPWISRPPPEPFSEPSAVAPTRL